VEPAWRNTTARLRKERRHRIGTSFTGIDGLRFAWSGTRRFMAQAQFQAGSSSVFAVAGVECIACRDVAILARGHEFTCTCGRSRAWCDEDEVELLGPCFAWMRSAHGKVRRRPVAPLL
jgi:hypothetical protein